MVRSIIGHRGTGKTRELIEYASQHGCTIVCGDVDKMIQKVHAYRKVGISVISYLDFLALGDASDLNGYCIDEIEALCDILGIRAFTLVN